ncbi:MAG: flagellar hook-basal body complex protein FliE [Stenotrophobium sp.]
MNDIDVNRVLSQIRALSAQASGRMAPVETPKVAGGFDTLVSGAIGKVDASQKTAAQLQQSFDLGDPSADIASVMIAQAKAQVTFRAMTEVRNRLVSAYQDIMNMPI